MVRFRNYLLCSRVLPTQVLAIFTVFTIFSKGPFYPSLFNTCQMAIVAPLPFFAICAIFVNLLTIIPRAQMGSEPIAHEAEGYK